jgi:hypothetical protein
MSSLPPPPPGPPDTVSTSISRAAPPQARANLLSSITEGKKLRPSENPDTKPKSGPPQSTQNNLLGAIRRGSTLKKVDHEALKKEKEEKKKAAGNVFGNFSINITCSDFLYILLTKLHNSSNRRRCCSQYSCQTESYRTVV